MASIFFDGRFVGDTSEAQRLVQEIRAKRRTGNIPYQVNAAFHPHLDEVRILSDSGRVRRPLIVVENGVPKLTKEHVEKLQKGEIKWTDLIKTGVVEFLDSEEEENCYIALTEKELTPEQIIIFSGL